MEKIKLNGRTWANIQMQLAGILEQEALTDSRSYHKENIPDTIYHYTSLNGLIGIIESQSLFSSDLNYLNDRKEYKHGIDLVREVIQDLRKKNYCLETLDKLENNLHLFNKSEKYVTCFSCYGDLLSQWRAYGNDGNGIAIGFNRANIEDGCFSQFLHSYMMLYEEEDQKYNIEKIITRSLEFFKDIREQIDWQNNDPDYLTAESIIDFLSKVISLYKHPSFKDEKEYRIEYEIDGNINKKIDESLNFRVSNNLIVPFIKLTTKFREFLKEKKEIEDRINETPFFLKRIPIDNIIVGPSLEFPSIKESIQKLLLLNGYEDVKVLESQVPYRI